MASPASSNKGVRDSMKSYWEIYSPSIESMMLSTDAAVLAHKEQSEILSYLPPFRGHKVLELGAGIGRFTCSLAETAAHVTAVDFIQSYMDENQRINGHLDNIDFICADVTRLDLCGETYDLVFSNWLFMYLSNEEVTKVMTKILTWLKPGGHFFLRESCYHPSGNVKREENPTFYRNPLHYSSFLHTIRSQDIGAAFNIIRGKNILTYIQMHGNPNQLCFLTRRVSDDVPRSSVTQFLDSRQYSIANILAYERIYGFNWICVGGEAVCRDMCAELGMAPGQKVLDVGCGTGGSAFFMARHYGVNVHGVDLSTNMIHIAIERQGKLEGDAKKRVQFEISDILEVEYGEASYDVIYSRDACLNISDKQKLFTKFHRWLKPGGKLLITDYCEGSEESSPEFNSYLLKRGYTLMPFQAYTRTLQEVGFQKVLSEELLDRYMDTQRAELKGFRPTREAFVSDFSQAAYEDLCQGWENKLQWAEEGELTWGFFTAEK